MDEARIRAAPAQLSTNRIERTNPLEKAMIADSINPSIRGRVMSTFQGVNMIGSAAGPATSCWSA